MKNNKILFYISGACFGLSAIESVFDFRGLVIYWQSAWEFTGLILVAVGFFSSKLYLSGIGCGIEAAYHVYELFEYNIGSKLSMRISYVLIAAFWIILLIACIKRDLSKPMGFAAFGVALVYFVCIDIALCFGKTYISVFPAAIQAVDGLPLIVPGALLFTLSEKNIVSSGPKFHLQTGYSNASAAQEASTNDTIERLTKLKTLLDEGIITKEEFESKKKDIIG